MRETTSDLDRLQALLDEGTVDGRSRLASARWSTSASREARPRYERLTGSPGRVLMVKRFASN